MIKVETWGNKAKQIHRFFGWNQVKINTKDPFEIKADDCYLSESKTFGIVYLPKEASENHPEYMCDYGEMSQHAEGMKTKYSGQIILDGNKYIVSP